MALILYSKKGNWLYSLYSPYQQGRNLTSTSEPLASKPIKCESAWFFKNVGVGFRNPKSLVIHSVSITNMIINSWGRLSKTGLPGTPFFSAALAFLFSLKVLRNNFYEIFANPGLFLWIIAASHLQSITLHINNQFNIFTLLCIVHHGARLTARGSPWWAWTTADDCSSEDCIDAVC